MDTKEQFKNLKQELIINGFLVSKEKEDSFCETNKLKIQRLSNGLTIVGTYLGRADSKYTSINFKFLRGSFDEPLEKSGIAHLYEHLVFSPEVMNLRNKFYVDIDGRTSSIYTEFKLGGVYNSSFLEYGILGSFKTFLNSILNPNLNLDFFNGVKNTLISEYSLDDRDFEYQAQKALKKIIFNENNYINHDIESGCETLANITVDDVRKLLDNFGPKNLLVYFLYEGEREEFLKLFEYIQTILSKIKSRGLSSKYYLDPILCDSQNQKTFSEKSSQVYKDNYPFQNGQVKITKFTSLPLKYCSENEYQTYSIFGFLKDYLHTFLREKGFSYRVTSTNYTGFGNYIIPVISSFEQREKYEKQNFLFDELMDDFYKNILKRESEIKEYIETEKIRQMASPIIQETILSNAVSGLIDFGLLRNTQFIRNAKINMTIEGSMDFLKSLSKSPLHTLIYGEGVC